MATSNFQFENICIVIDESTLEDFDFDWAVESWRDSFVGIDGFIVPEKRFWVRDSFVLGSFYLYDKRDELYASVHVTYKSGYHSDGCIDYKIVYEEDGDIFDPQDKNTIKMGKKLSTLCKKIEKIARTLGQEVVVAGRFSNGSVLYKKA